MLQIPCTFIIKNYTKNYHVKVPLDPHKMLESLNLRIEMARSADQVLRSCK